jgi:hypothetical protein
MNDNILAHVSGPVKHAADAISVSTLVATIVGWLPGITALLVAIWTVMRIYETWLSISEKREARRARQTPLPAAPPPTEPALSDAELVERLRQIP